MAGTISISVLMMIVIAAASFVSKSARAPGVDPPAGSRPNAMPANRSILLRSRAFRSREAVAHALRDVAVAVRVVHGYVGDEIAGTKRCGRSGFQGSRCRGFLGRAHDRAMTCGGQATLLPNVIVNHVQFARDDAAETAVNALSGDDRHD